ncbi:LexA family protein [Candidatus Uabimicrobium sp. HlEnr_7]|uniref:LexA family protein n=1 Tax=Candidatus Uabimicrobium helgolandensis TaxID=3095367 RepID=UPI00355790E2
MSYENLSTRKRDIFNYLKIYINKNGVAPYLSEIAKEFDISRERANHILKALVKDKKIRKTDEASRNIELL